MHYRNGRAAKIGDRVVGRCYNTPGLVTGTVLSITPGHDACSALVGFLYVRPVEEPDNNGQIVRVQGTEQHGAAGPKALTYFKQDYTHCGNLLHVEDLGDALIHLEALAAQAR